MKILFHLNSMGRGGAERVVSILSSAFARQGHEVLIATLWKAKKEYEVDSRVQQRHIGLRDTEEQRGRIAKACLRYVRLRRCIQKEKPDIVISFCNKANFRSALAMIGMKIPLLVSVRNDPQKNYAPYKIATKIMEHKAAGCVFQTPDAKAFFSKKLQKKSQILFNPLSEQYPIPKQGSIQERKKVIVTVGRIARQKNHMLLIQSFAKLCDEFPAYQLNLYGSADDVELYNQMKTWIVSNGLEERIRFMGVEEDLPNKIANAALFVLPSDYEGMPNALIEAMVLGLPVVATDCPCGGVKMFVENNVTGLLVSVGDSVALREAIRYMLTHTEEAEQMGKRARSIIDRVEPQIVCEKWLEYIYTIVEKSKTRF